MNPAARWALLAVALAPLLGLAAVVMFVVVIEQAADSASPACGGGAAAPVVAVPAGEVAGYSGEQLDNAATIMQAAADAGLGQHAQTLGVAAAMGESSLVNVGYGDAVGPDSTGLFQQRNPWAPRAARMDPYTAATMFFTGGQGGQPGLVDVAGWETLLPTEAIHRVQRNADPFHYQRFWAPAQQVVAAVSGADPAQLTATVSTGTGTGAAAVSCGGGTQSIPAGASGWVTPAVGPFTSGFGPRWGSNHNGVDIAPECGEPIYAATAGTVVRAGASDGYGNLIVIDHGGGVVTRYAHMETGGILAAVGQPVAAGQQIAEVGNAGQSTGCHLHFEVLLGGSTTSGFIDPVPFLSQRDVALAA